MTQGEVATRLDRHQPFVSNIENGQRRIDLIELLDLAEIIGFDAHKLLDQITKVPKP